MRLVPGSPADPYLGLLSSALKSRRCIFQRSGQRFQFIGYCGGIDLDRGRGRSRSTLIGFIQFISKQDSRKQQVLRFVVGEVRPHLGELPIHHACEMTHAVFLAVGAGNRVSASADFEPDVAHPSRLSIKPSSWERLADTRAFSFS